VSEDIDPKTSPPVGAPVDDRPAQRPGPVMLAGRYGRVEKLSADHAAMLWDSLEGHDQIWTYMPSYQSFPDAAAFSAWVSTRAELDDPCSYAIVDTGARALVILALMEIRAIHRVCEVGHVVYSPALQRTPLGTEAQYLLARYAFETLG
jgi:RimJ/RimL family protein N-acetyltransferase